MDYIGYTSPVTPPLWIALHGFHPRLGAPPPAVSPATGSPQRTGACAYANAFTTPRTDAAEPLRALIVGARCDQLRRMADAVETSAPWPTLLLHVPAAVTSPNTLGFFREELERLSRFLVDLGGQRPTPACLREALRQQAAWRPEMHRLRTETTAREFLAALRAWEAGEWPARAATRPPAMTARIPLALLGGPISASAADWLDEIESAGAQVVLDASETGERWLWTTLDPEEVERDPLGALARAALCAMPDVAQRPNDEWLRWVQARVTASGARGAVLWRHAWCDIWHAEVRHLQQLLSVPLLDLDAGDPPTPGPATRTRLQAFLEMLA